MVSTRVDTTERGGRPEGPTPGRTKTSQKVAPRATNQPCTLAHTFAILSHHQGAESLPLGPYRGCSIVLEEVEVVAQRQCTQAYLAVHHSCVMHPSHTPRSHAPALSNIPHILLSESAYCMCCERVIQESACSHQEINPDGPA